MFLFILLFFRGIGRLSRSVRNVKLVLRCGGFRLVIYFGGWNVYRVV